MDDATGGPGDWYHSHARRDLLAGLHQRARALLFDREHADAWLKTESLHRFDTEHLSNLLRDELRELHRALDELERDQEDS